MSWAFLMSSGLSFPLAAVVLSPGVAAAVVLGAAPGALAPDACGSAAVAAAWGWLAAWAGAVVEAGCSGSVARACDKAPRDMTASKRTTTCITVSLPGRSGLWR